ncbi:MAG: DUF302 domain-containing protein, partial [Chloroflexia bacterium]|nr:DUF302 domain-containing protein [Chloroflexia bacterium]
MRPTPKGPTWSCGQRNCLFFGNPELGTQLMQAEQAVGIDLPQK